MFDHQEKELSGLYLQADILDSSRYWLMYVFWEIIHNVYYVFY